MLRAPADLPGIRVVTAKHFPDERGFLLQSWVDADLAAAGIPSSFTQAIQTHSRRGVMRGLHFQWAPPMGKYVRCVHGAIIDYVVDVRHGSPTCGDYAAVELTDRNHQVIWVPPGFAHGTFALAEDTIVLYECTAPHGVGGEGGIRWNDPALGIRYPEITPIVSAKDQAAPTLAEWLADPRSRGFTF
jgi:dTDP-4-dehydrorhamnose 3,5-epimerase